MKIKKDIDATEAAKMLGVTRQAIYKYIKLGRLKALRIGKVQWLISRASVLEFKRKTDIK